ncbi:Cation efflux system protein CusA [Pontiella desulfatans]|uniref:Cation efflux system protein CusA n=1 Tax=Pontiella desulfatans TaxID=2750659 RepID=A0A6C2U6Z4_PONDE|nr:efflux RND transporter permease subunit [Pontiella desulfatans]VGO15567.1 Cation efflux system protein CusA [Pontiella desulfatans]
MSSNHTPEQRSPIGRLIRFCLENRLVVVLFTVAVVFAGILVAPFDWKLGELQRYPVSVDAIPDIGENQQIVFTEWMGRSPQDVEDQIGYPLTVQLLGIPGVKTVRSYSMFGFSSIYIIFKEEVEFYWSRTRVLEKLNSLPAGTLPEGVQPALGPDATALGQVFWYTLEGRDPAGNPTGGWDPEELRTIQDWYARYWLLSAEGVAEVASIGGHVREYQVDVDPDAMRAFGVGIDEIHRAVQGANIDVGAKSIEVNSVEYFIRGIGFIQSLDDIGNSVVKVNADNVPVLVKHVANVALGPAQRRGALDKGGAPAVGGVVVARYGDNPLKVIQNVKDKIAATARSLPQKTLADGTVSQVTVVPFYDRTGLIYETLNTLNEAIVQQILVTIIVVLIMVMHLRSGLVISTMLPLTVLLCFIGMKLFNVQANIVALSGIAIAIGTIVDMGIVICENIIKHLDKADSDESRLEVVHRAASEVGGAVLTAVLTTVISFLPVFTMIGAEGKLFKPLAFTKTTALVASIIIALTILPVLAHTFFGRTKPTATKRRTRFIPIILTILFVGVWLTLEWEPLGMGNPLRNLLFVALIIGGLLLVFNIFQYFYTRILGWCLDHKLLFLLAPLGLLLAGIGSWRTLGKEFMPSLDEGSFLWMPTTMTHASIGEVLDIMEKQDIAFQSIPEIESAVGKLGRAETPLDPAPISMIETVINYKSEYGIDADGNRVRQWRDHIRSPDDIWNEIVKAGKIPGTTSAPKLQPIAARIVMLQSGMRAPMGVKVQGPDLETIERVGLEIEKLLKEVPSVEPAAVIADRIVGKPYLEIVPDREALARYGIPIRKFQDVVEIAIGGRKVTSTVEGRERFPVRVRYQRELRDHIEALDRILVPGSAGQQIPITELAEIQYVRGPQNIKSEDTFLVGYVVFDKQPGFAEVDVVEAAQAHLAEHLDVPAGVSYRFAGSYENQQRAARTLSMVLPIALFAIFMIIYFQFKSVSTTVLIFTGVFIAWSGGFILLWLYGQPWFLDFNLFGTEMRDLFQVHAINLSVAVWVGFLALFGIATDDGVVMGTYLTQTFRDNTPKNPAEVRELVIQAGNRRVRACLMTTATTILALLPVLTSTGRGSDIMVPMAIPSFGGMLIETITMLVVPVLYCWRQEKSL